MPMPRTLMALIAGSVFISPLASGDVVREAVGQRRAELDKMELQPFPSEAWAGLTEWANSEALDASKLQGVPVLLVTWVSYTPASKQAMATVKRLAEQYGGEGLVVVGVHGPQGWDGVGETAKEWGLSFPLAHDAEGKFRAAIKSDMDPDFYVIDRAGHLRYADVATQSVGEAVREVVEESKEAAADVPRLMAEREAEAAAAARRTGGIRTEIELASLPEVPFEEPTPEQYKDARWPALMSKEARELLGMSERTRQAGEEPPQYPLVFTPEVWHPAMPQATKGRAYFIYMWHPEVRESYSIMGQMDLLQEQHRRDLIVVGAMIPREKLKNGGGGGYGSGEVEDLQKLQKKYDSFIKNRRYSHLLAADLSASALGSLGQVTNNKFPIPGGMLVSSDGVIRWVGWTTRPDFQAAIDRVLAVDPGVKARREAERAFIQSRKK